MIKTSIILILSTLLLFGIAYPLAIWGVGKLTPHNAQGRPVERNGAVIGYENIGQTFQSSRYFWGRPSSVGYDASATGGSNYGPSNPAFLAQVQQRIDTLLYYHPGKTAKDIPAEMVTASGGGIDPHISKAAALFQAERVASARQLKVEVVTYLIENHSKEPYLGLFGPKDIINVLQLNLALDELANNSKK